MSTALTPDYERFCGGVKQLCGIDLFQYRPGQMERRLRSFARRAGHDDLDGYLTALKRDVAARSAFLAHTRGGWRAAGFDDRGYLDLGTPATFAVWAVGDLVVQAPDDRIQTWSTDPRSGTPGLPDLSPGAPMPSALRTVVRGRTVFDAGGLS